MATEDKAAHKATELKGKAKEAVGDVTDDQDLQAEGQADQAEGNVKQAAGTPGESSADQLHKLADLKTQGVLTDAEFEAQKAKILAS